MPATEEAAVKAAAISFLRSFENMDVDGTMSYVSKSSPYAKGNQRDFQEIFTQAEKIKIVEISFVYIKVLDVQVEVRFDVKFAATDRKTGGPYEVYTSARRLLKLVSENGKWQIYRHSSGEMDFARRLIAEKSPTVRDVMLSNEKEYLNKSLSGSFTNLGNSMPDNAPPEDLLEVFRLGLHVAELIGDKHEMAGAWNSIGWVLKHQNKNDLALDAYFRSLSLWEESGDLAGSQVVLQNLGIAYFQFGELKKSLDFYNRCVERSTSLKDEAMIASCLHGIGDTYLEKGDYILALTYANRSLEIGRKLGNPEQLSMALTSIGLNYQMLSRHSEALTSFEESLRLSESIGDRNRQINDLMNMGNSYKDLGDFSKSMAFYQKSLTLDGSDDESPYRNPGVSVNIAEVYLEQGNYEQAGSLFNIALSIFEKSGSKYGVAFSLSGLAKTYSAQKDFRKAIEFEEKALAMREQMGSNFDAIRSLVNLGNDYFELGDKSKAVEYYKKAQANSEQLGYDSLSLLVHLAFAKVHLAEGDYAKAIVEAERADTFASKMPGYSERWKIYGPLGKAYQAIGKSGLARENYKKSILIIEDSLLKFAGGESEQERFFAERIQPYYLMIELLRSQNELVEAFDYSERSKSRSLLDILRNGRDELNKLTSIKEKQREQALRSDLVTLNAQISMESEKKPQDSVRTSELRKGLNNKRLEFENFQVALYVAHPELKVQRGEMAPISPVETTKLLLDDKSALIEYAVAGDKTFLFIITKDIRQKSVLEANTIDVKSKNLATKVEAYRSKLATGDLDFQASSRELYDLLLKPAAAQLVGKTNLIIVPDGPLWDLPFQALQDGKGKYLIEQAAVSYAPSLTALREMRKKAMARKPSPDTELLAFGNPIVGNETRTRVQRVFMSEKLEPIPEAERLVNELGKMYGPKRSKVFTGADAREEVAKTESPKYRIVQFATHGILNNVSPMYSHLVFAQNDKNPNEDGLLEAWELKDLDLKADMVILSACDTARGKISNGEGMIGMTWASFIAGAPTTVATQWKVESSSTTDLMLEFHRGLLSKPRISKAEALRRASLKLMKMPKYRHPSYWASFVLVGDGS